MAKVSERVNAMMKGFMALHKEGYSIPEIAKKFDLDFSTVYRYLQKIADDNGISDRNELLQINRKARTERALKQEEERINTDVKELKKGFFEATKAIQGLIKKIDVILEEEGM